MKFLIAFLLLTLFVFEANSAVDDDPIAHFTTPDSIPVEVNVCYDSLGLLEKYSANVYTPVCEGKKCYAIELSVYWDCAGKFLSYDTLPGKGLTKLDHIPFTASDYKKLQSILGNPNSPLGTYSRQDLVQDRRSSTIDGFTGATATQIKESVIGGAVYSCYTLWHTTNGSVTDSLQKATRQMFSKALIKKLVAQEDQDMNSFLINSFSTGDFRLYLSEVLLALESGKGYFAKQTIEKMPAEVLNEKESQDFFTRIFDQLDYYAQVALLEKLDKHSLTPQLRTVLAGQEEMRDSYKARLINSLLAGEH